MQTGGQPATMQVPGSWWGMPGQVSGSLHIALIIAIRGTVLSKREGTNIHIRGRKLFRKILFHGD